MCDTASVISEKTDIQMMHRAPPLKKKTCKTNANASFGKRTCNLAACKALPWTPSAVRQRPLQARSQNRPFQSLPVPDLKMNINLDRTMHSTFSGTTTALSSPLGLKPSGMSGKSNLVNRLLTKTVPRLLCRPPLPFCTFAGIFALSGKYLCT